MLLRNFEKDIAKVDKEIEALKSRTVTITSQGNSTPA
jgi:hypothetical protein